MSNPIRVDLGKGEAAIWFEAVEVPAEQEGRTSVAVGAEPVASLASAFGQFRRVFEIAQGELAQMREAADETKLELSAKLTTNGNLLIVQGSAEGAIKVTMTWKKAKAGDTKTA